MAAAKSEVDIDRDPNEVWALVREFGGLAEWMPGIDKCTVDGDVRTLDTMGIVIKEQLRSLDDQARQISYSVIESPMGNLESHVATISVDAAGGGTHLTWDVEVVPDELLPLFSGTYDGAVVQLKQQLEA